VITYLDLLRGKNKTRILSCEPFIITCSNSYNYKNLQYRVIILCTTLIYKQVQHFVNWNLIHMVFVTRIRVTSRINSFVHLFCCFICMLLPELCIRTIVDPSGTFLIQTCMNLLQFSNIHLLTDAHVWNFTYNFYFKIHVFFQFYDYIWV